MTRSVRQSDVRMYACSYTDAVTGEGGEGGSAPTLKMRTKTCSSQRKNVFYGDGGISQDF